MLQGRTLDERRVESASLHEAWDVWAVMIAADGHLPSADTSARDARTRQSSRLLTRSQHHDRECLRPLARLRVPRSEAGFVDDTPLWPPQAVAPMASIAAVAGVTPGAAPYKGRFFEK